MNFWKRFWRRLWGIRTPPERARQGESAEALLETARQEYHRKMEHYQRSLARIAGVGERLRLQIERKLQKNRILESRVLANVKAGHSEMAASLAREWEEGKEDLETDAQELRDTEAAYQSTRKTVQWIRREFEEKIGRLERMLDRARIQEAQLESAHLFLDSGLGHTDLSDTLRHVEKLLADRLAESGGPLHLAQDLAAAGGLTEEEGRRRLREQKALRDFMSGRGLIQPEADTPAGHTGEKKQTELAVTAAQSRKE